MNNYKEGFVLTVEINALNLEGVGISYLDYYTIYVPGALPSEKVQIKLTQVHLKFAHADLVEILKASPLRISPACPLFSSCGGCQLMHLDYKEQLFFKQNKVHSALKRYGLDIEIPTCRPSPKHYHYRTKIQLPLAYVEKELVMGLYKHHSHEIIPLQNCLIQCEQGEKILLKLQALLKKIFLPELNYILIKNSLHTEQALLVFVTSSSSSSLKENASFLLDSLPFVRGIIENINTQPGNTILGKSYFLLAGEDQIEEVLLGKRFLLDSASFFQVNPLQIELLYKKAIELAQITKEDCVIDAFCGVGTLSIYAADFAKQVIGIESVPEAIKNAKQNQMLNKAKNCRFIGDVAEKAITTLSECTILFVNPPRKGCHPEFITTIKKLKPKKIIYISCNPLSLARDLAQLISDYKIDYIEPFDMFPQTHHVETIVSATLL